MTPGLRRELRKWDLTAIGINQTIGSAIFLLPSQLFAQTGNWSPIAFLTIGFASLLVALCFAEGGSRFERTGGPYLTTRSAFGRFVGFEVGWMQWVSHVTSQAGIVNSITLALGFYWPVLTIGISRVAIIAKPLPDPIPPDNPVSFQQEPRASSLPHEMQRGATASAPAASRRAGP